MKTKIFVLLLLLGAGVFSAHFGAPALLHAQDDGTTTDDQGGEATGTDDNGNGGEEATPETTESSNAISPKNLNNYDTGPGSEVSGYNQFLLTEDQKKRFEVYGTLRGSAFIDNVAKVDADTEKQVFSPGDMTFEAFLILRAFGLNDTLSDRIQFLITKAFFTDIPKDNAAGNIIRNVIIPGWFDDGSPLIFSVTTSDPAVPTISQYGTGDYTATRSSSVDGSQSNYIFGAKRVSILYNADSSALSRSIRAAKKAGPYIPYPLFNQASSMDVYILPSGVLTSEPRQNLPKFGKIKNGDTEIALIHAYLRDGDRNNDVLTGPSIEGLSKSSQFGAPARIQAREWDFFASIFRNDFVRSREVLTQLSEDPALTNRVVIQSPSGRQAKFDLPRLYTIARSLNAGQIVAAADKKGEKLATVDATNTVK